jgi:hypothetical protein
MNNSATPARGKTHGQDIRDGVRFNQYAAHRRRMEVLWAILSGQPLKFPARRRREDREVPKAA